MSVGSSCLRSGTKSSPTTLAPLPSSLEDNRFAKFAIVGDASPLWNSTATELGILAAQASQPHELGPNFLDAFHVVLTSCCSHACIGMHVYCCGALAEHVLAMNPALHGTAILRLDLAQQCWNKMLHPGLHA